MRDRHGGGVSSLRARAAGAGIACVVALGAWVLVALAGAAPGRLGASVVKIPGFTGLVPVASAAGPGAGEAVVAGSDFASPDVIAAINVRTGQPVATIGSNGVLPLPSGLPQGTAFPQHLTFADNSIFATFSSGPNIYVASWTAQGKLNTGFGSGGLVRLAPPSPKSFAHGGMQLQVASGRLILDTCVFGGGSGGGVTLYPINPTTGSVGTAVSSGLPIGLPSYAFLTLNAMQLGPDGRVYVAGQTGAVNPTEAYYGIFSPSTLQNVSQTALGSGTMAQTVAFAGSRAFVGLESTGSPLTTTRLWSAPLGSTTLVQGPALPSQVSGDNQTLTGMTRVPGGLMDAVVLDRNPSTNAASTWAVQTDGKTLGPVVRVGGANTDITTVSADPHGVSGVQSDVAGGRLTNAVTRAGANAIALRTLGTQDVAAMAALFGLPTPLPSGTVVGAWSMIHPMPTVRLRHPAWLFWEDLEYGAEFAHPSQLLLIDQATGHLVAHMDLTMWPLVNGQDPAFVGTPGYTSSKYLVYSSVSLTGAGGGAADRSPDLGATAANEPPITHEDVQHDCLITIGDRRKRERFQLDFEAMRRWAKSAGFEDGQINRAMSSLQGLYTAVYGQLKKGCKDFLIFVAGHGRYPKGGKVDGVPDHFGPFAPPAGNYLGFADPGIGLAQREPANAETEGPITSFLTPDELSTLIDQFSTAGKVKVGGKEHELTAAQVKDVKFKIKLQTCYAGWFAKELLKKRGITPNDHKPNALLFIESSSSATESSWDYLDEADILAANKTDIEKKPNPRPVPKGEEEKQTSESTYANVETLTAWEHNPTGGRSLFDGFKQAFEHHKEFDFTQNIGYTHPMLEGPDVNLGTPDPTTAQTKLIEHKPPMRGQAAPQVDLLGFSFQTVNGHETSWLSALSGGLFG